MQALSRLGPTALFTTLVLALVGALFNNEYAFYTSWGDLLGDPPEDTPRHPVIVAMRGLPGSPESYNKLDHFYTRLDKAVSDRRIAAPIVVVPQLNRTPDNDRSASTTRTACRPRRGSPRRCRRG